ncbi:O-antigen polymerase [Aliarcobacter cryaerophilus]|uniref:O-antigen polymerase n=1 Tax=Aliarcobacter cryaerophilus TaxID=28198 RepID=UPI00082A3774|nr:O-antigen polymerase [Aliarcobacter cryaerophilus]
MNEWIFLYKVVVSICFLLLYIHLYKKIEHTFVPKLIYFYYFTFYMIGGTCTLFTAEFTDIFYPTSGFNMINPSLLGWIIYSILVYVIPYLFIIISFILFGKQHYDIKSINSSKYFIAIGLSTIYILMSININQVFFNTTFSSYYESVAYRASLNYSPIFTFLVKSFMYVLVLGLSIEYLLQKRKIVSIFVFIFGLTLFGLFEHFIFATKNGMISIAFSYLVIMLFYFRFKYLILFSIAMVLSYLTYYQINMGEHYDFDIAIPIIAGITRFTQTIPYVIDYYMYFDFDLKYYFYSTITGDIVINPNIKVYEHVVDISNQKIIEGTDNVYGTITSGIIAYNYANFGPLSIVNSVFEYIFLMICFKYIIIKNSISSFKIALLFMITYYIMHFEFITIAVNVLVGFVFYVGIYFIKDTLIPRIVFRKKLMIGRFFMIKVK